MSRDYAKDNRTTKKVTEDYKKGKRKESQIIRALQSRQIPVFPLESTDKLGIVSSYHPDAIIHYWWWWRLLEIKRSSKKLREIHWKANQRDVAKKRDWYLLIVCPEWCDLIHPMREHRHSDSDTYCSKPCKVFRSNWREFDNVFIK